MKVDVQRRSGVTVLAPRDALTEAVVPDFQQALEGEGQSGCTRLVLDLANVPYVDSAGIEALLRTAGDTAGGGLRPRLAALTDTVREALQLTDTLDRFFRFDTVDDAVRSFA